jgi:hypothetical protein
MAKIKVRVEMSAEELKFDYTSWVIDHVDKETLVENGFKGLKHLTTTDILNDKDYTSALLEDLNITFDLYEVESGSIPVEVELKVGNLIHKAEPFNC